MYTFGKENTMSMSISSLSSSTTAQFSRPAESNTPLTDDQKKKLTDILSKYDATSISKDGMKSLMEELKKADIKPGKEVREAMDAAGFKPPEKPNGQALDQAGQSNSQQPQFVLDFLQKAQSGSVSQDDITTLISSLQSQGRQAQGSLVDSWS